MSGERASSLSIQDNLATVAIVQALLEAERTGRVVAPLVFATTVGVELPTPV
jgi:hypothetical protein